MKIESYRKCNNFLQIYVRLYLYLVLTTKKFSADAT